MHHALEYAYNRGGENSHALLQGISPRVSLQIITSYKMGPPYSICQKEAAYTKRQGSHENIYFGEKKFGEKFVYNLMKNLVKNSVKNSLKI